MNLHEQTATFERLAFESALREHPGDETAALVFRDWLQEHGYTPIGARREVTRIIRQETERRQVDRLSKWCRESIANDMALRSLITRWCDATFLAAPVLHVQPGTLAPTWSRTGGYWIAEDGRQFSETPNVLELGLVVKWVPFEYSVQFGAGWALQVLLPESKSRQQT
jgi:uncharacterized protein (TIGR02996 family)